MIKEKLNKIFKENKDISNNVDKKNLTLFVEKIDTLIDEESERKSEEKLNQKTKEIKKKLTEKLQKENKVFQESYKKIQNKNLEKKLDIVTNIIYESLKDTIENENLQLLDRYVADTIKVKAEDLQKIVEEKVKTYAKNFISEEKELIKEYIEAQKGDYFTTSLLENIKKLKWEDKIQTNDNVKKLTNKLNEMQDKYRKMKKTTSELYKKNIFNEYFSEYTPAKQVEIEKYISENCKKNSIKEYKEICKKIVESKTSQKILLSEKNGDNNSKIRNKKDKDEYNEWKHFI